MDQRLLQYYNSELQYIRGMGAEFAKAYPKIARRLNLDEFECADPYVERLLEGFAFMAARVQLKMDDEFPRLTQHLFDMVYPDYLAPTPSMAIARFQPNFSAGALDQGFEIPRGTSLRSLIGEREQTSCEYRTAHPVTLWPIEIQHANYFNRESVHAALPAKVANANSGVRIQLKTTIETFAELPCDSLEFFLHGNLENAVHLYEQIFANTTSIGMRDITNDKWLGWIPKEELTAVGFDDNESMIPCGNRSFQGYRMLKEYFAFHQRFLFFRINGLKRLIQKCESREIELFILFDRVDRSIETTVDQSNFVLNCVPCINLFPRRAERVHVTPTQHEFHIVPDRVRPMDMEVYQIESVTGLGNDSNEVAQFLPFYSFKQNSQDASQVDNAYYTMRRTPRIASERQRRLGYRTNYLGSECYLSLVDGHAAPLNPEVDQLDVQVWCTNRDLPLNMALNSGGTDFTMEISAPVQAIDVLVGPTVPSESLANQSGDLLWRLVNHMSLNYLSVIDSEDNRGAAALRGLLKLFGNSNESSIQKQIDGVRSIQSSSITRRLPIAGPISFGRGLEIKLNLDESNFQGYGVFLMGAVLSRFFQRFASINSFTETVLLTDKRNEVMRWAPTLGNRKIL